VQRLSGFGLLQRERRFPAYEDTEARYERRPSAWVEPLGEWGPGRVLLLQLPTPDETHDNVVAYWTPATLPPPGQALALDWRLRWQGDAPAAPPHGHTVQTRAGQGWDLLAPDQLQFLIDFDGPALRTLPPPPAGADTDPAVELVASAGPGGRVLDARAWPHPLGGWRARLRVQRTDPHQALELRAHLRRGPQTLTETWTALVPQE
jgi:glucans biosynthesis protein